MILNKKNKNKLLRVAKSLDKQPINTFNMNSFNDSYSNHYCAIGYYIFKTSKNYERSFRGCHNFLSSLVPEIDVTPRDPIFNWTFDDNLVKLFGEDCPVKGPKSLAKVIRRFVKTGKIKFLKKEVKD